MTSKEECTSGAAPLAGAVRPDEKIGAGGSAPAPVPAGDAALRALEEIAQLTSTPKRQREIAEAALSKQVPAGDAVALAAEQEADAFLAEVRTELIRARAKFPGDRIMTIALAEEFGELCKAVLDESSANVRKEAVQTAVMACRVAVDGDGSVDAWRRERGLDPLTASAHISREGQADSTGGTTT